MQKDLWIEAIAALNYHQYSSYAIHVDGVQPISIKLEYLGAIYALDVELTIMN
jgi:hypothetical protein